MKQDAELCLKCRSWRILATETSDHTRYDCLECHFAWLVTTEGKFNPLPDPKSMRGDGLDERK